MANNVESTLESLKSQYRILISEIDDCVGKGYLIKRKKLLEKVSKVAGEIRAIETPISETNLEQQPHKPYWVEIENEKHNLDLSKISLYEKTTKDLIEDNKHSELDLSSKKDLQEKCIRKNHKNLPKESEEHFISVFPNEKYLKGINKAQKREEIEDKKRLINLTKLMSDAPVSEGGISRERANKTIQLLNEDLSNLKKELRELEPEPQNTDINAPSESIGIESKEKTLHIEANAEESNRHPLENSKYESVKILDKNTDIPKSESRSRYALFVIIFIISIISIAIFVGINSNNNTLDTSNRTIPVTIPVNDIQQNPVSPITGTWKFENTQGIVSTIIFDENDNAILDGKLYKYSIVGSNLVLKDNKSSSTVPYKLVDEKNLLLKLRGSNNDNYVKVILGS